MNSNFNTGKWQLVFDDEMLSMMNDIINCTIPGLSISYHERPVGKGLRAKLPGDTAIWEDLPITFIVDDLMLNYEKLQSWIKRSFDPFTGKQSFDEAKPAVINICRDSGVVRRKIKVIRMFPTEISGIELLTNEAGEQFEVATVNFLHDGWKFEPLK